MAELKTKPNKESVEAFLQDIEDVKKREDCLVILNLMKSITSAEPKMWGDAIVGFGSYHYIYKSGREGDWLLTGFSPRKQNLTIYIMDGFESHMKLMKKLGKHRTGKSCLYIKNIEDIDLKVLKELIQSSIKNLAIRYDTSLNNSNDERLEN